MQGKVALITGAASGIAAATALELSARGCLLSLVDVDEEKLQVTAEECRKRSKPENVHCIGADLAKDEDLAKIVDGTIKKFHKLDILLNIAGVPIFANHANTSATNYDTLMAVNVRAVFHLTQLAMPHLIKTKGNVVSVSSVGAFRPAVGAIAYCMGNAALDMFTKCVALEVASSGVRVNSVSPGNCKTSFLDGLAVDVEEIGRKLHALKRLGMPEEIAQAIIFLADDNTASFITGSTLVIDGGMSLMGPQDSS